MTTQGNERELIAPAWFWNIVLGLAAARRGLKMLVIASIILCIAAAAYALVASAYEGAMQFIRTL